MPELQLLRLDHAEALLAFESTNRAYFAASISDRGDAYFQQFAEQLSGLLAEQASGNGAFYVLVADDSSIVGRFNLKLAKDGTAELGYRVAETATGRGVATAAVEELCRVAPQRHGVRTVRAATSAANVASQRVLLKAGFLADGPADPQHIGGKVGTWYSRHLAHHHDR
jgi:ribosomal-protein-alanine N-acetyltransferase